MSMMGFFILAGFLLASSTTRPIEDKWNFYRNRIVAAHPLYLLAVCISVPIVFWDKIGNPTSMVITAAGTCPAGYTLTYSGSPTCDDSQRIVQPCHGGSPCTTEQCGNHCTNDAQCRFFFANDNGGCHLYTSCDSTRNPSYGGTTCQKDELEPVGFFVYFLYSTIVFVFGQQAWPWGLPAFAAYGNANGPLWFSSAYYFCLVVFPFVHKWLAKRTFFNCCCRGKEPTSNSGCCGFSLYCCWPICGCIGIINCCTLVTFFVVVIIVAAAFSLPMEVAFMSAYMFPPIWAGIFTLGVFLYNLFELSRRGKTDEELWPHWGKVADGMTFVFFLSLLAASGLASLGEDLEGLLGAMWSRPLRFGLSAVCLWIYALATGKGFTARLFRSRLLVKYVSPASYVIYLIHWPVATYFMKLVNPDSEFGKAGLEKIPVYQFFVLVILITLLAMFLQHYVSAPLTTCFMRCFDAWLRCCCCCCKCGQKGVDEDASTLVKVIHAIQGLTGADVDGATPLTDCGLDSFGTSALVGVLRAKIPGVRLSPIRMYQLQTVAEVADEIEKGLDAGDVKDDAIV